MNDKIFLRASPRNQAEIRDWSRRSIRRSGG
jgi:hypothetical protein